MSTFIGSNDSVDKSRDAGFKDGMKDKYDDDNSNYNGESSDDNSSFCFVTTACIKSKGLSDDCTELTTLRNFRKDYVLMTTNGVELNEQYKKIAPTIVSEINKNKNSKIIYDEIYNEILNMIDLINSNNNEKALTKYIKLVENLSKLYVCSL